MSKHSSKNIHRYSRPLLQGMRSVHLLCLLCIFACIAGADRTEASMLPLFRDALENRQPETYEIVAVYRNTLNGEENAIVDWLEKNSQEELPYSNFTVRSFNLLKDNAVDFPELERNLISADPLDGYRFIGESGTAPFFVLLTPPERGASEIICKGPLTFETVKTLVDSPVRKEIAERILSGDSAVWVFIESGNTSEDAAARDSLATGLAEMNALYAPQEPGDEERRTFSSDMPISFSSITLSRSDPLEIYSISILLQGASQPVDADYPLVVPVFGRGRVLEASRADTLTVDTIEGICSYLVRPSGVDSNQDTPGYDLLMLTDWDAGIGDKWFVLQKQEEISGSVLAQTALRYFQSFPFEIRLAAILILTLGIAIFFWAVRALLLPGKACLHCHERGVFSRINRDGICRKCTPVVKQDMTSIKGAIRKSMAKIKESPSDAELQKLYTTIISKAREALDYEQMGIPFPGEKPSELIDTYSAKLDTMRMASKSLQIKEALSVAHDALKSFGDVNLLDNALQQIVQAEDLLRKSSTRFIAFINQKGGVGKTTSTLNIGAGLSLLKKKVLLIDFDPQANLTDCMGIREDDVQYTIYDLIEGNVAASQATINKNGLSIIPCNIMLTRFEEEYKNTSGRNTVLRNALREIDGYDYVLIDCPPTLGLMTLNALTAAHEIYIPFMPEYFALKGIHKTLDIINYIRKTDNKKLVLRGLIGTRYDGRKMLHQEVVNKIEDSFKSKLYYTVREDVTFSEASSYGQTIFDYSPHSVGSEDYMGLCRKILNGKQAPISVVS